MGGVSSPVSWRCGFIQLFSTSLSIALCIYYIPEVVCRGSKVVVDSAPRGGKGQQ